MRRVNGTTVVIAITMFLFVAMAAPVYADSTTSTRSEIDGLRDQITLYPLGASMKTIRSRTQR
jgi:hypothetical protein